ARPMFLEVEDLSGKKDARAQSDCACQVQRDADGRNFASKDCCSYGKHGYHREHQQKALGGGDLIPMRSHEDHHSPAQHQHANSHSQHGRPAQPAASGFLLELADAIGGLRVNQFGVHPALKVLFPVHNESLVRFYDPGMLLPGCGGLSNAWSSLQLENPWYRRNRTKPWNSTSSHAWASSTSRPSIA